MKLSIITSVHNEYELLRQFVESLLQNVDLFSYSNLIVVDDYSLLNSKVRQYEKYLDDKYPNIQVISYPEQRYVRYYEKELVVNKVIADDFDYRNFDYDKPNMGHLVSLVTGAEYCNSDIIFMCDSDNIFLRESFNLFNVIANLFDTYPDVMAIGQTIGHKLNEIKVIKERYSTVDLGFKGNAGGFVSQSAAAIRYKKGKEIGLSLISEDKRNEIFEKTTTAALNFWNTDIFRKGFNVLNMPIYSAGIMMHLGNGHMKKIRADKNKYGFTKGGEKYSVNTHENLLSWHLGRLEIDMKEEDYKNYLFKKYSRPFEEIQAPIDEELLKNVDED